MRDWSLVRLFAAVYFIVVLPITGIVGLTFLVWVPFVGSVIAAMLSIGIATVVTILED